MKKLQYMYGCVAAGILAAGVSVGWPVLSHAEPSKEETEEFIKTKVHGCGKFLSEKYENLSTELIDESSRSIELTFSGDKLMITEKKQTRHFFDGKPQPEDAIQEELWETTVKLPEASPEVEIRHSRTFSPGGKEHLEKYQSAQIVIRCSGTNCVESDETMVVVDRITDEQISETYESLGVKRGSERWYLCNNDTADRVAKALSHLIKLHGGKAQLF